jgi:hypothetical protein
MSGLTKRAFSSSNINIRSNAITNINQGGGDKKAGLPFHAGRMIVTYVNPNGTCCSLADFNCVLPFVHQSPTVSELVGRRRSRY